MSERPKLVRISLLLETETETLAYFSVLNDSIREKDFPSKTKYKEKIDYPNEATKDIPP